MENEGLVCVCVSGDHLVHTSSTLLGHSETTVDERSLTIQELRASSFPSAAPYIVSPLRFRWFKGGYVFSCNLPPALLEE